MKRILLVFMLISMSLIGHTQSTVQGNKLKINGESTLNGEVDVLNHKIVNLANAINLKDAVNLEMLNDAVNHGLMDSVMFNTAIGNLPVEEGKLYYSNIFKTLVFNPDNENSIFIGRMLLNPIVINKTGVTIENLKIVVFDGVSPDIGGIERFEIKLADNNTYSDSRVVGVTTDQILNNDIGNVTWRGLIQGNTSAWVIDTELFLGENGEFTDIKPTGGKFSSSIAIVKKQDAVIGEIFVNPKLSDKPDEITSYRGVSKPSNITVFPNELTRTMTLSPTVGVDYYSYEDGDKYISTGNVLIWSDVEGVHCFYLNKGVLIDEVNPTKDRVREIYETHTGISQMYWNAADDKIVFVNNMQHTFDMNSATWAAFYDLHKCKILSGLNITDILVDENGNSDTHAQFGHNSGKIRNQDITTSIPTVASTTGYSIFYLTGTNEWRRDETNGFPIFTTGTGRAAYNLNTLGTWSLAEVTNNDFVLVHLLVSNTLGNKTGVILGQNQYTSISNARVGAREERSSIKTNNLPIEEVAFMYTVIFQTSNTYSNTVQSRIRSSEDEFGHSVDAIDWRDISNTGDGGGGGGAETLLDLTDTPLSYAGADGKLLVVDGINTIFTDVIKPFIVFEGGVSSSASNTTRYGSNSAIASISGFNWTANGDASGYSNTSGSRWTAVGSSAGFSNVNGSDWSSFGRQSGFSNTSGSRWTAVGSSAGSSNSNGSDWTVLGYKSGTYRIGDFLASDFSNSVYVGASTRISANGVTNENVFGYAADGKGSNTVAIGNSSITDNYFNGNGHFTGDITAANLPSSLTDLTDTPSSYSGLANRLLTVSADELTTQFSILGNTKANNNINLQVDGVTATTITNIARVDLSQNFNSGQLWQGNNTWHASSNTTDYETIIEKSDNTQIGGIKFGGINGIVLRSIDTKLSLQEYSGATLNNELILDNSSFEFKSGGNRRLIITANDTYNDITFSEYGFDIANSNIGVDWLGNGNEALRDATNVSFATGVGNRTFSNLLTGDLNVGVGFRAAENNLLGNLTIAEKSVYVGALTKASIDGVTNENVFGYAAVGEGSNTVRFGDSNITDNIIEKKLTIKNGVNSTSYSTNVSGDAVIEVGVNKIIMNGSDLILTSLSNRELHITPSPAGSRHLIGSTNTAAGFRFYSSTQSSLFDIDGSGNGDFLGNLTAANFPASDRRIKSNISNISHTNIDLIDFKQFNINRYSDTRMRYGVIAQELEALQLNDLVYTMTDSMKTKGVNYIDLLILEAARSRERVEEVKQNNILLMNLIDALENRIKFLEAK